MLSPSAMWLPAIMETSQLLASAHNCYGAWPRKHLGQSLITLVVYLLGYTNVAKGKMSVKEKHPLNSAVCAIRTWLFCRVSPFCHVVYDRLCAQGLLPSSSRMQLQCLSA